MLRQSKRQFREQERRRARRADIIVPEYRPFCCGEAKATLQEDAYAEPRGKQTMRQLMDQDTKLTNVEITSRNIKSFERVANRYGIDFALKKDLASEKPRYLVFFKAKDMDVMKAAFQEFSAKELAKTKRPSIRKQLTQSRQKTQHKQLERAKTRVRGQERGRADRQIRRGQRPA